MQRTYKQNIVDFIEGRMPPAEFEAWFESTPAALDWLQSLIPEGMTMDDCVEVTMDYFLKKLPVNEYEEITAAYRALCEAEGAPIEAQIPLALEVVRLLSAVDPKQVGFDSISSFHRQFVRYCGEAPSRWRRDNTRENALHLPQTPYVPE